ncbi:DUF1214 domain-containing protein [Prolixibacteraceae bacterium]|nr:DUF1214 domain-containing protein [Prolixibacteraceae bacterium]
MKRILFPLLLAILLVGCNKTKKKVDETLSSEQVVKRLVGAYLYGYPLLSMEYTKITSTNIDTPNKKGKAPINQFGILQAFPKAGFKEVVRPNVDTYYCLIWTDLKKEPLYITIPKTDRYYLMPILNAYTEVISSVGSRATGQDEISFILAGPNFKGQAPEGVKIIHSETNMNWLLGRVAVADLRDGKEVTKNFQNKLKVVPLSQMNNPDYKAPKGTYDPKNKLIPMEVVDGLDIVSYFDQMLSVMVDNPALKQDEKMIKIMASVGLYPGEKFDITLFPEGLQEKIKSIPEMVQMGFVEQTNNPNPKTLINGWKYITGLLGNYGTNYSLRAYIAKIGLGANQDVDAIYPNTAVDVDGAILSSKLKYKIHFKAKELPPAKGFWSLTVYDKKGYLVDNPINRYNLGSLKELEYNKDGSLDIYIQAKAPRYRKSNWLPSPQDGTNFEVTLRIYWPKKTALDRSWSIPGIQKIK